jgi:hypothetical protein
VLPCAPIPTLISGTVMDCVVVPVTGTTLGLCCSSADFVCCLLLLVLTVEFLLWPKLVSFFFGPRWLWPKN